MKTIMIYLITLACPLAMAEPINISLNATKNATGLGERILTLDSRSAYEFKCQLSPKDMPPPGTIFLDITVCDTHQLHHCPYSYSEGHADLKQAVINFQFSPQIQYIGEKNNFFVIMQYLPLNDHQKALAKYELLCNYKIISK